jgi:hypothetical protein
VTIRALSQTSAGSARTSRNCAWEDCRPRHGAQGDAGSDASGPLRYLQRDVRTDDGCYGEGSLLTIGGMCCQQRFQGDCADRRRRRTGTFLLSASCTCHRTALAPLGYGLRVHTVPLGQRPQALLTMLYRSTDRLCRAGAPVKYLAHNASFHSREKYAPSNSGTKHLIFGNQSSMSALS